jgi:hypothetical protein
MEYSHDFMIPESNQLNRFSGMLDTSPTYSLDDFTDISQVEQIVTFSRSRQEYCLDLIIG